MNALPAETPEPTTGSPADRPTVRLLPGRQKRVRAGHPWVYSNEIDMTPETKAIAPGSVVTLVDSGGTVAGTATFNPHPLISARVLTREDAPEIDTHWLTGRLRRALAMRERLFDAPYYRLVHSEADGLPGLVADRYGDVVVLQVNTAGMDRLTPALIEAVQSVVAPSTIVLRNDGAARAMEGLDAEVRVIGAPLEAPVELVENGVRFVTNPADGQKTGWFFDHRETRARVAGLSTGLRVLDVYAYLSGFGIQAAVGGAAEVVCVDRSQPALDLAATSAALNDVAERCTFVRGDAFDELARLAKSGERFDVVVADPPAFVKSKKDFHAGLKGYRKLARMAAALVAPDGWLLAASCSHHVDAARFAEVVRGGLRDVRRGGRIVSTAGAGPDHPVHPYLPESAYLKSILMQLD